VSGGVEFGVGAEHAEMVQVFSGAAVASVRVLEFSEIVQGGDL
jgi:hypothetical protein